MVIDALGKEVKEGDIVLYAQAGRGAQEFLRGTVVKVNTKSITIEGSKKLGGIMTEKMMYSHVQRNSKCFVIKDNT